VTPAKAAVSVKAKLSAKRLRVGSDLVVSVTATSSTGKPVGKVRLRIDGKTAKIVALKNGKASVRISGLKRGTHRVTAAYVGSAAFQAKSVKAGTVKVLAKK
jgi:hypothetical protein